mgnify:FL=1
MKIKLTKEQHKKLINEVGGYDDPTVGMRDEEAILGGLIESYKNLTRGMTILDGLVPGVIVHDKLRRKLMEIHSSLVGPINGFSAFMKEIHGQQSQEEDLDR